MKKTMRISMFFTLSIVTGTLAWQVLEAVLALFNIPLSLSVGPIGFDLAVLSVYAKVNPGSGLGLLVAYSRYIRL